MPVPSASPSRPVWRSDPHYTGGLLLVLALCLLAAWPFLLRPSLSHSPDMTLHVQRVAEYTRLLDAGVSIPRWSPHLFYGYGYPVFSYYGPASYGLAALLGGSNAVSGAKLALVACFLVMGAGMYALGWRLAGARAGIVAALVYVYCPYVVLVEPHLHGTLPGLLALAMLPWCYVAFYDLLHHRRALDFGFAALSFAVLLLAHNLMAAISAAMLLGWLLWHWLLPQPMPDDVPRAGWRSRLLLRHGLSWGWTAAAFLLGIGLTAYFWLPVATESRFVRVDNLLLYNFRDFFTPPGELFGFSPVLDLTAANPAYRFNLGVAAWGLGLLGGAGLFWQWRRAGWSAQVKTLLFFLVSALLLLGPMLEVFAPLWDVVPLMDFLLFPWRFLGSTVFCLALLAGFATTLLDRLPSRARAAGLALMIALPVLLAFPTLVPPDWPPDYRPLDPLSLIEYEIATGVVGTTALQDFRPVWSNVPPEPDPTLLDSYRAPGLIDKVRRAALPPGAAVTVIAHSATSDTFRSSAPEPFTLVVNTLYWPGWTATLDGAPVEIAITAPHGLVSLPLPAGEHEVHLSLQDTPERTAGQIISAAAALGIIGLVLVLAVRRDAPPAAIPDAGAAGDLRRTDVLAVIASGGVLLVLALVLLGQPGIAWRQSPPGTVQGAEYAHYRGLTGDVAFLAYDLHPQTVRPGEAVTVTLYWQATGPITQEYHSFMHLVSTTSGERRGQADKVFPGGMRTLDWPVGRYVRDVYALEIGADVPPGEYALQAGLWTCGDLPPETCGFGTRLTVFGPDGQPAGDALHLPTLITVQE